MYYNGSKIFLIAFFVSLFTSAIVCAAFFFVLPSLRQTTDVVVPDLLGSNLEQARVIAESRDLLFVVGGEEENEKYPASIVCRQVPLSGSVVEEKTAITVFVSKGSSKLALPDLRGMGLSEATVRLTELGLKINEVKTEENEIIEKDKIVNTVPAAGASVDKGDAITVVLSRGTETVEVPRLTGKALSTAQRLIKEKGLVVGNISYEVSTEVNVGIVIRQHPQGGEKVKKGSAVSLVVATVLE